ncbi:MAG: DUF2490 domain-containing protein [Myxococcota bacterium]|nr:DUF2490 domain-containing protein [Myxococcota bacterium]
MNYWRLGIVLMVVSLAQPLFAKSKVQVWTSAGFNYPLSKKVQIGFEEDLRLENSARDFDATISDFSLSWRVWQGFNLETGYRFELNEKLKISALAHRGHVQGRFKQKLGLLGIVYRLRLQHRIKESKAFKTIARHQVRLGWNAKAMLSPDLGLEIFSKDIQSAGLTSEKLRMTAALIWRATKTHRIRLFYHAHKSLVADNPLQHVLGLSYRYKFRR